MSYQGAYITEYRHYDNPADPENSDYRVALFKTALEAVVDTQTGENLGDILRNGSGAPTPALMTQEQAEAGTDTEIRSVTAERLRQAADDAGGARARHRRGPRPRVRAVRRAAEPAGVRLPRRPRRGPRRG